MVDKLIIEKTFNKLQLKHGAYFTRIRGTLKKITDNEEEYKTLRDDIFQFYLESRHRNKERLILKTKKGNFFDNPYGTNSMVEYTEEMQTSATNEGVLYTGHNHPLPNGDTCFQSMADFYEITMYNEKYAWTIGKDGLMIVTNKKGYTDETRIRQVYGIHAKQLSNEFEKECNNELDSLKKKYPNYEDYNNNDSGFYRILSGGSICS